MSLSILIAMVVAFTRDTSASGRVCPDTRVTLHCATKDQWLTVLVNGTGGPFVTTRQDLCLNGCNETLSLPDGSVATVVVTVTAGTMRYNTTFIARPSLNGTTLSCFSSVDGDKNTTVITIIDPPQTAPSNLTFNFTACTLTWTGISEEEKEEDRGVFYECSVTFPGGYSNTTNVTGGKITVHYEDNNCRLPGNVSFAVRTGNCAGMGPSVSDWQQQSIPYIDDPAMRVSISKGNSEIISISSVFGITVFVIAICFVICFCKRIKSISGWSHVKKSQHDESNAEPQDNAPRQEVTVEIEDDGGDGSPEASTEAVGDVNELTADNTESDDTERDGIAYNDQSNAHLRRRVKDT